MVGAFEHLVSLDEITRNTKVVSTQVLSWSDLNGALMTVMLTFVEEGPFIFSYLSIWIDGKLVCIMDSV